MNTLPKGRAIWLSVFGLGYLRPASGTWGSMPAVAIAAGLVALSEFTSMPEWVARDLMILGAVYFTLVCVLWGSEAEARWGKDPSAVVADEMAGQFVTLAMIPFVFFDTLVSSVLTLLGAFLLFRAFDILKPWPAGAMQRVRGGWGIVLDDLFAGAMAGAVIWIVYFVR